jgi:hypothetical protein
MNFISTGSIRVIPGVAFLLGIHGRKYAKSAWLHSKVLGSAMAHGRDRGTGHGSTQEAEKETENPSPLTLFLCARIFS